MRRILSLFLLLLIVWLSAGYVLYYRVTLSEIRSEIKKKIKSNISENELVEFQFSSQEFENLDWEKEGKEFHLGTKMYDVVTKTIVKDKIIVKCIDDKKEAKLMAHLDDWTKQAFGSSQNTTSKNAKCYAKQSLELKYFFESQKMKFFNPITISKIEISTFNLYHTQNISDILSPPPQQLVFA